MSVNSVETEQIEKIRAELNQQISAKLKNRLDSVYNDFMDLYNNTVKLIKMNIEDIKELRGTVSFMPILSEFEKLNKSFVTMNCVDKMDKEPLANKEAFILDLNFIESKIEEKATQLTQKDDDRDESVKSTRTEARATNNKNNTTSHNNKQSKNFSFLNMFKLKKKDEEITKAHLEEEVKSYYDPVKKRWIFEGEEDNQDEDVVKPPPLKKDVKGSVTNSEQTNKSTSDNKLDALMQPLDLLNRRKGKKGPVSNKPKTTKLQIPSENSLKSQIDEFNIEAVLSSDMLKGVIENLEIASNTETDIHKTSRKDMSKFIEVESYTRLEEELCNLRVDYNKLLNEYVKDIDEMHEIRFSENVSHNMYNKLYKNKGIQIIDISEKTNITREISQNPSIKYFKAEPYLKVIEFLKEAHKNLPNIHKPPNIIDLGNLSNGNDHDKSAIIKIIENIVSIAITNISKARNSRDAIIQEFMEKYKELKETIVELANNNNTLTAAHAMKSKQLDEVIKVSDSRYKDYSTVIVKMKEIIERRNSDLTLLSKRLEKATEQLILERNENQNNESELKKKLNSYKKQIKDVKKNLHRTDNLSNELKREIKDLKESQTENEKKVHTLEQKLENAKNNEKHYKEKLNELTEQYDKSTNEFDKIKRANENLQKDLEDMRLLLNNQEDLNTQKISEITSAYANLKTQYEEIDAENIELKKSISSIETSISERDILIEDLTNKVEQSTKTHNEKETMLLKNIADLEQNVSELKQEVRDRDNLLENKGVELSTIENRYQQEIDQKTKEIDRLKDSLEKLNRDYTHEIAQKKENLFEYEKKSNNMKTEIEKTTKKYQSVKDKLNEKVQEISDLEERLNYINEDLETKDKKIDEQQKKIEELEYKAHEDLQTIETITKELEDCKSANERTTVKTSNENEELKRKLNELNAELDAKDNQIKDYKNQIASLQNKIKELNNKVEEGLSDLESVKNDLEHEKSRKNLLKKKLDNIETDKANLETKVDELDYELKAERNRKFNELNALRTKFNRSLYYLRADIENLKEQKDILYNSHFQHLRALSKTIKAFKKAKSDLAERTNKKSQDSISINDLQTVLNNKNAQIKALEDDIAEKNKKLNNQAGEDIIEELTKKLTFLSMDLEAAHERIRILEKNKD